MLVLKTMRELLKFKDYTTIPEIAKYSDLKQADVLSIINANSCMVFRNRENGKITKVDPRGVLIKQLRDSGKYYEVGSYGMFSHEGDCLCILGEPFTQIPDEIYVKQVIGSYGDSRQREIIPLEAKDALEELGFLPWDKVGINDRLWVET